ncbi:unnamed protein product, partial [Ceratitis capitata]
MEANVTEFYSEDRYFPTTVRAKTNIKLNNKESSFPSSTSTAFVGKQYIPRYSTASLVFSLVATILINRFFYTL